MSKFKPSLSPAAPAAAVASHVPIQISTDPRSFVSALVRCRTLTHVKQVHAMAISASMLETLPIANKLLYIYSEHKSLAAAHSLFCQLSHRDNFSWSVMVGALSKMGHYRSCLQTFKEFVASGLRMDNFTLPFALRACRDTGSVGPGMEIHQVVCKTGLSSDVFVSAAVVDMYAKCGRVEDARRVFDKMLKKDLVTWTVMISGYAECGDPDESLVLFERMKEEGLAPDKVTMVAVVFACAKLGAMHKAKAVHKYALERKFSLNVFLGTAMIDMYAKCGSSDAAWEIFCEMKERNVITWSSMMSAYAIHGRGRKAVELFPRMVSSGIRPNQITFVSVLSACSHAGLVDEGRSFFRSMERDYSVRPDVKHYTCMVDLLGRAGRLDEVLELSEGMEVEKDEGFWGAVLGACRIHGDIALAEKAAKSLLELCPRNSGYYVLLSNIYAKAGRWEDVADTRNLMGANRVKKIPGWTWIEINDTTHQFRVGDRAHPQSEEIYGMLKVLSKKLELAGYAPDTNFVLHDVDDELKAEFLYTHSEKLAIAYGLIATPEGTAIRMTKNLRVCGDCHTFTKMISSIERRDIVVRDANRFHHFSNGLCSCGDYW